MSSLRSALEELQAEDISHTSDQALEGDFSELHRAAAVLEAERLRRLAEIHRRQSHRRDGYLSTSSWLVDRHRFGWTAAGKDIRTARSLQRMPHTREGLAAGELSASAVQMLVTAQAGSSRAVPRGRTHPGRGGQTAARPPAPSHGLALEEIPRLEPGAEGRGATSRTTAPGARHHGPRNGPGRRRPGP